MWAALGAFFVATAAFLFAVAGHRVGLGGSALFLVLVLAAKLRLEQRADDAIRWLRGARAEEAVGDTLNELRREGWTLMHDVVQRGEGNIDHIASGPNGVYLIETKCRAYKDETQLTKVKRQAAKLHEELGVWVTPVICLHERRGNAFRTKGVWVVPRVQLLDWLRAQRNQPVPFDRLARYADSVE